MAATVKKSTMNKLDCIVITNCDFPVAAYPGASSRNQQLNQVLYGKVVLRSRVPVVLTGVACQLEGRAKAILTSKYTDRVAVRASQYYFYLSQLTPLTCAQEIQNGNENAPEFTVNSTGIEFPFKIPVDPKAVLPASFEHSLGSIRYQLSIHVRDQDKSEFRNISQTTVQLRPQRAKIRRPLSNQLIVASRREGQQQASGGNNFIEAELKLATDTFLMGDTIQFWLKVRNHGAGRLQGIKVALMRKTGFYADRFSKSDFVMVAGRELRQNEITWDEEHGDQVLEWRKAFPVPSSAMPSFATKEKCIEILYFIQFIVFVIGKGQLQGEKRVFIATHHLDSHNPTPASAKTSRKSSLVDTAAGSIKEPPPPYWTCNKDQQRASQETLPPTYEEAVPIKSGHNETRD